MLWFMALQSKARYFNSRSEKNFPEFKFKTEKRKGTIFPEVKFKNKKTKINRQNGQKTGKNFLKFSGSHVFLRHFNWNRKWGQCHIWKRFSNILTRKLRRIWNLSIKPFGKNMPCPSFEIISVRLKNHGTTNFTAMDHAPMSIISR